MHLSLLTVFLRFFFVSRCSCALTQGVAWDPIGRFVASIGAENRLLVGFASAPRVLFSVQPPNNSVCARQTTRYPSPLLLDSRP